MAPTSQTKAKATRTKTKAKPKSLGAPAQHAQSSRKGKKAWRKNVDLIEVEEGLEGMRDEERITGGKLQHKPNAQLFEIDVTGDAEVRKAIKKSKPLRSTLILSQRSAIPAIFSRASSAGDAAKKKLKLSHEEKGRLLRIGKKDRKSPFGAIVDPTELGAGSAILEPSEAVKQSGKYDVWMDEGSDEELSRALKTDEAREYILPIVQKPKVKAPKISDSRHLIALPAVDQPHPGSSYNPPVSSHQELLRAAHEAEERRVAETEKYSWVKEKMQQARREVDGSERRDVAPGMQLDLPGDASEDDNKSAEGEETAVRPSKTPSRKTKRQRQKAMRALEEKRAAAERASKRQLAATISSLKSIRKDVDHTLSTREHAVAQRKLARREKLKEGPAGQRLGKHTVPEGDIDVQLGEDLTESFRALKPEGNLFKDRFVSLQKRAIIEPRVRVVPKRIKNKPKEYEKHPWKRFE